MVSSATRVNKQIIKMPRDFDVFRTVLYYSIAIIALPISTFFTSKILVFDRIFDANGTTGNIYAAIAAVVMLHVALAAFVYKAYSGDDDVTPSRKPEKAD